VGKRSALPGGTSCQALQAPCLPPGLPHPISGICFLITLFVVPAALVHNAPYFLFSSGFSFDTHQSVETGLGCPFGLGLLGQVLPWEASGRGRCSHDRLGKAVAALAWKQDRDPQQTRKAAVSGSAQAR